MCFCRSFPGTSTSDLIPADGENFIDHDLTQLSVCFWLEVLGEGETILSWAVPEEDDEFAIWVSSTGHLGATIGGIDVTSSQFVGAENNADMCPNGGASRGVFHHVCAIFFI